MAKKKVDGLVPQRDEKYGRVIPDSEFFIPTSETGGYAIAVVHHGDNVKMDLRTVYTDKKSGERRFGVGLRIELDVLDKVLQMAQQSMHAALGGEMGDN